MTRDLFRLSFYPVPNDGDNIYIYNTFTATSNSFSQEDAGRGMVSSIQPYRGVYAKVRTRPSCFRCVCTTSEEVMVDREWEQLLLLLALVCAASNDWRSWYWYWCYVCYWCYCYWWYWEYWDSTSTEEKMRRNAIPVLVLYSYRHKILHNLIHSSHRSRLPLDCCCPWHPLPLHLHLYDDWTEEDWQVERRTPCPTSH